MSIPKVRAVAGRATTAVQESSAALNVPAILRLRMLLVGLLLLGGAMLFPLWPGFSSNEAKAASGIPNESVTQRAWLDDPAGSLTAQQALSRPWTPYRRVLARGYTDHVTWLRLRVDPRLARPGTLATDQRLVLRIEPGHLDEVTVFRADDPSKPLAIVGDTTPRSTNQPRWLVHSVVIPQATEPFEVLLRLRSQGTHIVKFEAMRWDEARELDQRALLRVVLYEVFTVAFILWALSSLLSRRDAVLGLFVAHQCAAMCVAAAQLGLVRLWAGDWLPSQAIDGLSAFMIPVYTTLIFLFHVLLLRDLGAREPDRSLLPWTIALPGLGLIVLLAGFRREGLLMAISAAPLFVPVMMIVAWRCRESVDGQGVDGSPVHRIYRVSAYGLMVALTLPQALAILGVRTEGATNFDWFMTYSLASAVLMAGLLRLRSMQIERQRRELTNALAESRRQEQLQAARAAEQSELVTMLVHELKTPLSVINLALGRDAKGPKMRERAVRSVTAMQEVIDRCAQIARFDHSPGDGVPIAMPQPVDPKQVVSEAVALQPQGDRIRVEVEEPVPPCQVDRQMLLLVLNNLLDNAVKYGPPEEEVTASLRPAQREGRAGVAFCVANAVGRAGRPDVEHLFRKYHRGAYARHRSGSGLGLYLAQRLAARLGGSLSLLPGDDVRFELWIPCALQLEP